MRRKECGAGRYSTLYAALRGVRCTARNQTLHHPVCDLRLRLCTLARSPIGAST